MANISFGERMRRARIQIAWTQADLGEKVGVSAPTISNWENGKFAPDADQKDRIRVVLGLNSSSRTTTESEISTSSIDEAILETGPSAFGTWLNRTRIEKRYSVAELASKSGVSVPGIYNIEKGKIANPRSETVKRLEQALG